MKLTNERLRILLLRSKLGILFSMAAAHFYISIAFTWYMKDCTATKDCTKMHSNKRKILEVLNHI